MLSETSTLTFHQNTKNKVRTDSMPSGSTTLESFH